MQLPSHHIREFPEHVLLFGSCRVVSGAEQRLAGGGVAGEGVLAVVQALPAPPPLLKQVHHLGGIHNDRGEWFAI